MVMFFRDSSNMKGKVSCFPGFLARWRTVTWGRGERWGTQRVIYSRFSNHLRCCTCFRQWEVDLLTLNQNCTVLPELKWRCQGWRLWPQATDSWTPGWPGLQRPEPCPCSHQRKQLRGSDGASCWTRSWRMTPVDELMWRLYLQPLKLNRQSEYGTQLDVSIYRWLGAPDESNNSILKGDVFGCSVSENIDVGGGRGTCESQLET